MAIWNKQENKIPHNNNLDLEVERLSRIIVALRVSFLEKRFKHTMQDIDELDRCYHELKRLLKEGDVD